MRGERERVRSTGRDADRDELRDVERIGDCEPIACPVRDAPTWSRCRSSVPRPVDADDAETRFGRGRCKCGRFYSTPGPAVAPDHRCAVRGTVVDEADASSVGDGDRACIRHSIDLETERVAIALHMTR